MATSTKINSILSQIKILSREDQYIVLKRIVDIVQRNEGMKAQTRLSMLSGLGSEIWKSKDVIDGYLDEERGW